MAERVPFAFENQIERTSSCLKIFPKSREGCIGLVTVSTSGEHWKITDFVLSPEVRGKGLGSNLLQLMETNLKEAGGKTLYIDFTNYSNDGVNLRSGMTDLKSFLLRKGFTSSKEEPLLLTKYFNY